MFGSYLDRLYGRSPQWRKVRNEFIKTNNKCAACGRDNNLEVHHIVPYHIDHSLELDHNNLITLCGKHCHFIFGHFGDWKSWNKNVVQDSKDYYIKRINRPHQIRFTQMPPNKIGLKNVLHGFIGNIKLIIDLLFWRHNKPKCK